MLHEINSVKHSCFEIPLMLTVHSICICICIYFEVWGARYIYLCDVYIYLCIYIYIHIWCHVSCVTSKWMFRVASYISSERVGLGGTPNILVFFVSSRPVIRDYPPSCTGGVIPMQKPNKTCCLDQNQNAHMQMQRNVCERNWNNFWPAYHPCPPTREKNDFRFQWVHSVSCHVCLCLFSRF